MKSSLFLISMLALFSAATSASVSTPWTEDDFTEVSGGASPHVAYALHQDSKGLTVLVDVAPIQSGGGSATVNLGLQAARKVVLSQTNAKISRVGEVTRYTFTVPARSLVSGAPDWDKLRMGFTVAWPGGPFGTDRQRERFLHPSGAVCNALSADPQDWQPINLKEHAEAVANRKKRIFVNLDQPMDGKATIVMEDAQGQRVRNLISGQPLTKGAHRIEWDGLDDKGNVVPAGNYRWRAIAHPGISPKYLFSFGNYGNPPWGGAGPTSNWLADESNPVAATSFGDRVYLGCPTSESGNNLVQLDLTGEKVNHAKFLWAFGQGTVFLAADGENFYALLEGAPIYPAYRDKPDKTWEFLRPLDLVRWSVADGQQKPYPGTPRGEKVITENAYSGTGLHLKDVSLIPRANNLAGAALLDGKLYISLRQENRILILNAADGKEAGEIKLENPGVIATDGKQLLVAFSGNTLMRIDPATNQSSPLFTPALSPLPAIDTEEEWYGFFGRNPTGIAINANHEIFLSDNGVDQNIKVFNLQGELLRQIGKKGGRALNGPWDPIGMIHPHGITVDNENKLWVTETSDFPRRNSVWNAQSGALLKEYVGPPYYGAPKGTFDPEDHTRWLGCGVQWKLDFDKKTATPVSTLYHKTKPGQLFNEMLGHHWNIFHKDRRTFLIGSGQGQPIYELKADGSAKLWAFCSPLTTLAQFPRWTLPKVIADLPAVQALIEANAAQPAAKALRAKAPLIPFGPWGDTVKFDLTSLQDPSILSRYLLKDISILWVDKNGDDIGQPDEFEVFAPGDIVQPGYWGTSASSLDFKLPATLGGKPVLLNFQADGFLPSGAPNYNLAKAIAAAVPIPAGLANGAESLQDQFGRQIFNSSPMTGVGPDGQIQWTFPNQWTNVHGSHEAPLPERGVMQGCLSFLGSAPLDHEAEIFIMNGNHGRFFALTTDGFYLDEMFKDVRVTQIADANLIGGEPFGGHFGRCENGKYYLQSGHTDYRIFQIEGLDKIQRTQGTLKISPEQAIAVQANHEARAAVVQQPKFASIIEAPAKPPLSKDPAQWPGDPVARWGDPQKPFPSADVRAVRQGDRLYLSYRVKDPSPWVNHGNDWTMLFKTGDSVDFQFSTDPKARPDRTQPVPGDRRLLIAPFKDRNIAVLYCYREPGAAAPLAFTSPGRTEKVDRVVEISSAQITVQPGDTFYTLTVSVPLADLGLPPAGQEMELKGDFGVVYGDTAGSMNILRSYWSNQATGLVNDVPGEVSISPRLWGTLKFNNPPTP